MSRKEKYGMYFISSFFAIITYIISSGFFTDDMNARYMLSALVQSEAAVIAIFITINLIGIQLGVTYSEGIARAFSENSPFRVLVFSYVFAILYGLCILGNLESSPDALIRLAYSLGVFSFSFLVLYTIIVFKIVLPSENIERQSYKIKKENILNEKDIFQIILDIIKNSIRNLDKKRAQFGLTMIGDKIEEMIENEKLDEKEELKIAETIYLPFIEVGNFAMHQRFGNSAVIAIENIEKIGKKAVEKGFGRIAWRAGLSLSILGNDAMESTYGIVVSRAILSLHKIGEIAIENKFQETANIVRFIEVIKDNSRKIGLENIANQAEFWLENLERIAEEKGDDNVLSYLRRRRRS